MTPTDIVHVAIAPPARLEVNLIRQVAAIGNKDLYGLEQLTVKLIISLAFSKARLSEWLSD